MATKDRRSNMAYGGYKDPAKKDGAGGAYTWGSPTDVTDYDPSGFGPAPAGVVIAAPVTYAAPQPVVYAAPPNVASAQEFPTLGTPVIAQRAQWGPPGGTTTVAGGSVVIAGAPVAGNPVIVQQQDAMRPGVVVDSSHPRNQFVSRPHKNSGGSITTIDWSSTGTPQDVSRALIRGGTANHVSPVAAAPVQQQVPLSVIRQAQQAPRIQNPPRMAPRNVIQQPMQRGAGR